MEEQKIRKNEPYLEDLFSQIDDLITKMEDKEVSLEDSFLLYEDGLNKLKTCNDKIDQVEKKLKLMTEDGTLAEIEE